MKEIPRHTNLSDEQKDWLLSLSRNITACLSKEAIRDIIKQQLGRILPYTAVTVSVLHPDGAYHSNYLYSFPDEMLNHQELPERAAEKYLMPDGVYELVLQSEQPLTFDLEKLMKRKDVPGYVNFFYKNGIREMVGFPIRINNKVTASLWIHVKNKQAFSKAEIEFTEALCSYIAIAMANIEAYEKIAAQLAEINLYKAKLEEENLRLHEKVNTLRDDNEMVGTSPELKKVFELTAHVAFSDSTVLLCGETGTGKELVATAIHQASPRSSKTMVKVNCAALPANLVESELFGHEKGSFTGATERRVGKFELAHNSTLFLDEIGEMPLELQVKLLRAIQEKEIERIGGREVIKTKVRIIVATNRDLQKEVTAGRFRTDLFYRLNVFPISLPPLRDRKEDIPLLAARFMSQMSKKCGKNVSSISPKALQQLIAYHWPGNVRELEHLMERAVLLASGSTIKEVTLPSSAIKEGLNGMAGSAVKTINEIEREYILLVLQKTGGKIHGAGGAAELLKIPATTLASKMQKLGIRKSHV